MIAEKSGGALEGEDLNDTLKELFRTFFPDKTYEGVRPLPGGSLEFPVSLPGGASHDIDELSSGEKEILYGYLRLRNSTPPNSIILLDEPELHLNPSLLQGFADFYHRHLGQAQGNQLWLVTHSDTLLRQAVGNANYGVYHMSTAAAGPGNQASEVVVGDDVARATIDLVGDLAAYRPHAKVVVLEGENRDAFDEGFVRRLFPDFSKRVNLVSGGSKDRVRNLYSVLEQAASTAGLENRFFAIVDKDSEMYVAPEPGAKEFSWPVYHIENFLLAPWAIRAACLAISGTDRFSSDEAVKSALRESGKELLGTLTLQRVRDDLSRELVGAIKLGGRPSGENLLHDLMPALDGSLGRLATLSSELTSDAVSTRLDSYRAQLEESLASDAWLADFPARSVLRRFAATNLDGQSYLDRAVGGGSRRLQ